MNAQRATRSLAAVSPQAATGFPNSKPQRVSREDSPAWQGDTARGDTTKPGRKQPWLGGTGGQWSVVGAVPGAAALPRLGSTLH